MMRLNKTRSYYTAFPQAYQRWICYCVVKYCYGHSFIPCHLTAYLFHVKQIKIYITDLMPGFLKNSFLDERLKQASFIFSPWIHPSYTVRQKDIQQL